MSDAMVVSFFVYGSLCKFKCTIVFLLGGFYLLRLIRHSRQKERRNNSNKYFFS